MLHQSMQEILAPEDISENNIFNLFPNAVYFCDQNGYIRNFNEEAVLLWGRRPQINNELERYCGAYKLYKTDGCYIPPHQSPSAICLLTGEPVKNQELIIERPDQSRIHVLLNIVPVKDENGRQVGIINSITDITEQKQRSSQLQEYEENYRSILNLLPVAVYTCDPHGYVTYFNEEAAKLWGREPEIGKDLWCGSWKITTTDGTVLPLNKCPMAKCLKEQKAIYGEEIIIEKPNGDKRFVLPHPQPLYNKNGNIYGAVNMLIDITNARTVEDSLREKEIKYRDLAATLEKTVADKTIDLLKKNEELQKSEERYHKMVDEVEDYAIILLDENGYIRNWNKGAEKIKGYKDVEILGKSFEEFYLPQDRKNGLPKKLITKARSEGKAIHEGWRMKKDGSAFYGSIVLTALHNDKNEIIGFSKVTRDLTERKITEDKFKEYASQLKFQNEQLEQFAYAASHDMKEPIRKILFYNNHLLETVAGKMQDKEREYLNRSINAARRMEKLINDLLEYSKAASGAHGFSEVDLNEVIDETLLTYKDIIDEKSAIINFDQLPVINGISFQLRQLFDNLISNALKYQHPERTPLIQISSQMVSGKEFVELHPDKTYYRIEVSDNGIGFDAEYSEKIFELFQRLENIKYSGTGVGLALCKRIVQNHHGTIQATGKANEGANFTLFLPAS